MNNLLKTIFYTIALIFALMPQSAQTKENQTVRQALDQIISEVKNGVPHTAFMIPTVKKGIHYKDGKKIFDTASIGIFESHSIEGLLKNLSEDSTINDDLGPDAGIPYQLVFLMEKTPTKKDYVFTIYRRTDGQYFMHKLVWWKLGQKSQGFLNDHLAK